MFLYIVSWLQLADGIAPEHALEINTVSMPALLPAVPVRGLAEPTRSAGASRC